LGYFDSFHIHHITFLNQSAVPLLELDTEIASIQAPPKASGACKATSSGWLSFPEANAKRLSYGNLDGTLRISGFGGSAMLEGYDNEAISEACFAGEGLLITASRGSMLNVWKYSPQATEIQFQHVKTLRGHASSISAVAASKVWSLILSCDEVSSPVA
jgi:hypothetical protein